MLFCTQAFLLFFLIVFGCYWAVPNDRFRVFLLLAASIYFYSCWNAWLSLLIVVSTAIDYTIARGLDRSQNEAARRAMLATSICFNLALLCYFKYANFFLESLGEVLRLIGAEASLPTLQVILPIGISFYTFEAISYIVDVYNRRISAERSLPHFLLFILFFPHLVAGPIVRARDFLPQIARRKRWNWMRMQHGVELFLLGLFKKMAIADRMAAVADPIFADPDAFRTSSVWLGVLAYSLQIYCDFSGYSDMAIGIAHLFGFKLGVNFRMPYLARNMAEFWHRWHISLSTWLRDYVFIPLGGSRGTSWQTHRNLMITMILGGLWHGASWPFVIWGVLHGGLLVMHRMFRQWCERNARLTEALESPAGNAVRIALTLVVVSLGWVLFRAPTMTDAWKVYRRLFVPLDGGMVTLPLVSVLVLIGIATAAHLLGESGIWRRWWKRMPSAALALGYASIALLAALLAPASGKAFIYFQF